MSDNNMNVADRLADKIKNSELGSLMDEADIYALSKQAIEKAFFSDRVDPDRYSSKRLDPLIVEMARETFRQSMAGHAANAAAEVVKTPEFVELVGRAVMQEILAQARTFGGRMVNNALMEGANNALEPLGAVVRKAMQP